MVHKNLARLVNQILGMRLAKSGIIALSLFLVGCAGANRSPASVDPRQTTFDMIEVALTYIDRMHVRPVPLDVVAISGLNELRSVDPQLSFRRSTNGLVAQVGSFAREFPVNNANEPAEWARASVLALESVKSKSPNLVRVPADKLYGLVFDGYESNLDRFSRYLEPNEVSRQDDRFLGFGGLGVTIDQEPEGIRITSVNAKSPAEKAGLLRGDLINGVNGSVFEITDAREDRLNLLKGPIGSRAEIAFLRRGRQGRTVVTRDEVIAESVDYQLKGQVAHIIISTFNRNTAKRVKDSYLEALVEAKGQGRSLNGVVLDVRDNGGGLRSAVVDVADIFLANRLITRTRGRTDRANRDFRSERPDISGGVPLAVLINEGSASASELLAAGLQDNGRAIVVGSTSYGKGSVQSKLPLPNDGELALTTAEFFGPSGAPLHQYGVVPTICTSDNVSNVSQVVNQVQTGRVRIAAASARRELMANKDISMEAYRNNCPPSAATPNRDFDIASALLNDQRLYTQVLRQYANMQLR